MADLIAVRDAHCDGWAGEAKSTYASALRSGRWLAVVGMATSLISHSAFLPVVTSYAPRGPRVRAGRRRSSAAPKRDCLSVPCPAVPNSLLVLRAAAAAMLLPGPQRSR